MCPVVSDGMEYERKYAGRLALGPPDYRADCFTGPFLRIAVRKTYTASHMPQEDRQCEQGDQKQYSQL